MSIGLGDLIDLVDRYAGRLWRGHYRVPRSAYAAAIPLGGGIAIAGALAGPAWLAWVGVACVGVSLAGLIRWAFDRKRCAGGLVVARFEAPSPDQARQVQRMIIAGLQDQLTADEARKVQSISGTVGPADRRLAGAIFERLQPLFVVHGEIRDVGDGQIGVYARLVEPAPREVAHYDPHTKDRTPHKTTWKHRIQQLTGTPRLPEIEYPLQFVGELGTLVRGVAGELAGALGDFPRAERLLREALADEDAPRPTTDRLRVSLADAIADQGRRDEARQLLRNRARDPDASGHVLRGLARHIFEQEGGFTRGTQSSEESAEMLTLWRRAAQDRDDPEREVALHNVANALGTKNVEAEAIIQELLTSTTHYRDAWYMKRTAGAIAWWKAIEADAAGDHAASQVQAETAAKYYSAAIRARPRFRFLYIEGNRRWWIRPFWRSAILHMNASEAHGRAGHGIRARWHLLRALQIRRRLIKRGDKRLKAGNFYRAYACYDWADIGLPDDQAIVVRTVRAVLRKQLGQDERADAEWRQISSEGPMHRGVGLLARSRLATNVHLPRGVPGPEPTDLASVERLLTR